MISREMSDMIDLQLAIHDGSMPANEVCKPHGEGWGEGNDLAYWVRHPGWGYQVWTYNPACDAWNVGPYMIEIERATFMGWRFVGPAVTPEAKRKVQPAAQPEPKRKRRFWL